MVNWEKEILNMDGWQFGDSDEMADSIADLTISGNNRATCSLASGNNIPQVGEKHFIKNSRGEPVCVIELTRVFVTPFNQVDKKFANAEGYKSLEEWRDVHQKYFIRQKHDFSFDDDVICQHFIVVHKF